MIDILINPKFVVTDAQGAILDQASTSLKMTDNFGNSVVWKGLNFSLDKKNISDIEMEFSSNRFSFYRKNEYETDSALLFSEENWQKCSFEIVGLGQFSDVQIAEGFLNIYNRKVLEPGYISSLVKEGDVFKIDFLKINKIYVTGNTSKKVTSYLTRLDWEILYKLAEAGEKIVVDLLPGSVDFPITGSMQERYKINFDLEFSDAFVYYDNRVHAVVIDIPYGPYSPDPSVQTSWNTLEIDAGFVYDVANNEMASVSFPLQFVAVPLIENEIVTNDRNPRLPFTFNSAPGIDAEYEVQIANFAEPEKFISYILGVSSLSEFVAHEVHGNSLNVVIKDTFVNPLNYGTYFWKVRRNSGKFSNSKRININSGDNSGFVLVPNVVPIVFEIGKLIKYKIKVLRASGPEFIVGAQVKLVATYANSIFFEAFVDSNNEGIAEFYFNAPKTIGNLHLVFTCEGVVLEKDTEIQLTPFSTTKISLDVANNEFVTKYNIYRKAFAPTEADSLAMKTDKKDISELFDFGQDYYPGYEQYLPRAKDVSNPSFPDRFFSTSIKQDNSLISGSLYLSWEKVDFQGDIFFYDAKAVSKDGVESAFAVAETELHKRALIFEPPADGVASVPYGYLNAGAVLPTYIVERIGEEKKEFKINENNFLLDTNDDDGFDKTLPNDVDGFAYQLGEGFVQLQWSNPKEKNGIIPDVYYKVTAYSRTGSKATSFIYPTVKVSTPITNRGVLVVRKDSTSLEFEEKFIASSLSGEFFLAHGSILSHQLTNLDGSVVFSSGTGYNVNIGDEDTGVRGSVVFPVGTPVAEGQILVIKYKYGLGTKNWPAYIYDMPVYPKEFVGYEVPVQINDPVRPETKAYVYGAFVIDDRGRVSKGKQIQVLYLA